MLSDSDAGEVEPLGSASVSGPSRKRRGRVTRQPKGTAASMGPSVTPSAATPLVATSSMSAGMGKTHSLFLEDVQGYDELLKDEEVSAMTLEDTGIEVHGILKCEKGELDALVTRVRQRHYMLKSLIGRLDAALAEVNGTLMDELTPLEEDFGVGAVSEEA